MSNSRSNKGRPMATRTERRRAAVDRRRQSSRKGVVAQVAARRRRSRIRWAVAAVGVGVIGVAAIVAISRRGDDGIPNVTLTGKKVDADGALGVTAPLDAYTIDYDLTSYSSDPRNPVTGTEQIQASRPFASRLTFTDSTGASSVYASVLGARSVTDDGTTTVSAQPATAALYDWRFDASLDDLVEGGEFELKERREVAGRQCQVYRTGSPVEAGTITAATESDYADICIDASGLVLEEVVYLNGGPYQHVVATNVSEDPVDDISVDGDPDDPSISFTEVDADTAPAEGYWTLSTVPDGYELVGRYAYSVPGEPTDDDTATDTTIPTDDTATDTTTPTDDTATDDATGDDGAATDTTVPADDDTAGDDDATETTVPADDDTTAEVPPVVTYFDVYRNGGDFLIVQQGPASELPMTYGRTADATIDPLGAVTTGVGFDGSTIVASPATSPDRFVAISGSVDLATLTTIAGTLTVG